MVQTIGLKLGGLSLVTCHLSLVVHRNSASDDNQPMVTRFIAMGDYGNPDKANKGMYAFSIEPMVAMEKADLGKVPEDTTESPYSTFLLTAKRRYIFRGRIVQSHYTHATLPLDTCAGLCLPSQTRRLTTFPTVLLIMKHHIIVTSLVTLCQ